LEIEAAGIHRTWLLAAIILGLDKFSYLIALLIWFLWKPKRDSLPDYLTASQ